MCHLQNLTLNKIYSSHVLFFLALSEYEELKGTGIKVQSKLKLSSARRDHMNNKFRHSQRSANFNVSQGISGIKLKLCPKFTRLIVHLVSLRDQMRFLHHQLQKKFKAGPVDFENSKVETKCIYFFEKKKISF